MFLVSLRLHFSKMCFVFVFGFCLICVGEWVMLHCGVAMVDARHYVTGSRDRSRLAYVVTNAHCMMHICCMVTFFPTSHGCHVAYLTRTQCMVFFLNLITCLFYFIEGMGDNTMLLCSYSANNVAVMVDGVHSRSRRSLHFKFKH